MEKNGKTRKKEDLLTEKQEAYCQNYILTGNQSTSYRAAYDAEAMNENSVYVEACRLHATPKISLRIEQLRKEAYERNKITLDELIHSLAGMVRFDPAEMYDDNGNLKSIHMMPKEARQMIAELTSYEEYQPDGSGGKTLIGFTKKAKTVDRLAAIEKLMKHLGGYEKDNLQKPQVNVTVVQWGDKKIAV